MQDFFRPSSSQRNEDFSGGGNFCDLDFFWLHSGQNRGPTVNFFVLFSRFRPISQAREVEMTHFKRPKSSTGCGQSREALGRGPTPSGGSGMNQEGSLFCWNYAWAGNFLGRSYCLHVAHMLVFPLTANFLSSLRPHFSCLIWKGSTGKQLFNLWL